MTGSRSEFRTPAAALAVNGTPFSRLEISEYAFDVKDRDLKARSNGSSVLCFSSIAAQIPASTDVSWTMSDESSNFSAADWALIDSSRASSVTNSASVIG